MSDNYFNDSGNSYDSEKLYNKWKSLEQSYDGMNQEIWNAKSDYYMSLGPVGMEELESLKRKEIIKDYKAKKKQYTKEINKKYDEYYDKLDALYNLKEMNSKQTELINNTQYKILEQRNIKKEVMDDLSTKQRLMTYERDIAMKRHNKIKNNVYLMLLLIFLLIVIFGMNAGKLSNPQAMYDIFKESNQTLALLFLVIVLFTAIVFKAYNLVILVLAVYAFLTILSS